MAPEHVVRAIEARDSLPDWRMTPTLPGPHSPPPAALASATRLAALVTAVVSARDAFPQALGFGQLAPRVESASNIWINEDKTALEVRMSRHLGKGVWACRAGRRVAAHGSAGLQKRNAGDVCDGGLAFVPATQDKKKRRKDKRGGMTDEQARLVGTIARMKHARLSPASVGLQLTLRASTAAPSFCFHSAGAREVIQGGC